MCLKSTGTIGGATWRACRQAARAASWILICIAQGRRNDDGDDDDFIEMFSLRRTSFWPKTFAPQIKQNAQTYLANYFRKCSTEYADTKLSQCAWLCLYLCVCTERVCVCVCVSVEFSGKFENGTKRAKVSFRRLLIKFESVSHCHRCVRERRRGREQRKCEEGHRDKERKAAKAPVFAWNLLHLEKGSRNTEREMVTQKTRRQVKSAKESERYHRERWRNTCRLNQISRINIFINYKLIFHIL